MSLSEQQEAFKKRVLAYADKMMGEEYIEYYAKNENTKAVREKLIKTSHYYHILQLMGDQDLDEDKMNITLDLAKEKITKVKDRDMQRTEVVKINLIGNHTSAWNIAHYHYEKAVKTLCMMMVTFMDYIIQEQGGESVIYEGLDKTKYFNLLDEITALNEDYQDDYFSVCTFDFCTKKLGKYMNVPEYDDIAKEHDRIGINGNPERVTKIMNKLKSICGEQRREVFIDIEKAYTPEPLYSEEIYEACYEKALEQYDNNEELAMSDFNGLVSWVNMIYQTHVKQ
ncbi:MAG: hypothetical protein E7302_16445 [Butyrivibrio sp.]|nr:hypothetical protein [Butyrivibrio sp.]